MASAPARRENPRTNRVYLQTVPARSDGNGVGRAKRKPSLLIPVFFFSLLFPAIIQLGPLRLSPYRILLILLFLPCLVAWISGSLGKIRISDILVLLYCIWASIALTINHDLGFAIEPSGILLIETFGSYLLARWIIRNADSFRKFAWIFFWSMLLLMPVGLIETISGRNIALDLIGTISNTFEDVPKQPRWGLDRVQGPFEHPILYGVFCSSGFALAFYVLGQGIGLFKRIALTLPALLGTFMSLSSGPLSALLAQIFIIGWDTGLRNIKNRWTLFIGLSTAGYIAIDLLSNRDPIRVLISYFAFNTHTAFNRILIWDYGSAEVLRNPIYGIGLNDWTRAWFMSTSIDMFWLIHAIRYGLPAALCFAVAVIVILVQLGRLKSEDQRIQEYRTGLVITIAGLALAGWTVHFWNATYSLFMFLLGSGTWMLNTKTEYKNQISNYPRTKNSENRSTT